MRFSLTLNFLLIYIVYGLEDDLKFEISWLGSNKDIFQVYL